MERDRSNYLRNHDEDDSQTWPDSDSAEQAVTSSRKNEPYVGANKDVAGNDKTDEERDRVRHHQAFGNKKYESFKNHSSADDQPMTDTGV